MKIPIIDLFAGPGGLGEGFSSNIKNNERIFDIKLSIEMDENAHKTLQLRSFFRRFPPGAVPPLYYDVLKESNNEKREILKQNLFAEYPQEANEAREEAWCAELGGKNFPERVVDERIENALGKKRDWLLIGGPPCQAYSLVGRSRVGGIDKEDHRVYLYKEYLRIIAKHQPAVFVMENVKGLLSANVNGQKVFDWIKKDLQKPSSVFPEYNSKDYRIYSLSTPYDDFDSNGNPVYKKDQDYLIKAEDYGVPQKRHRVIILGIRSDIPFHPETLKKEDQVALDKIIGDLPPLRSGLSRTYLETIKFKGKTKRIYSKENDSDERWSALVNSFREEVISWNGFAKSYSQKRISPPKYGIGSEFVKFKTPSKKNPLYRWFNDDNLNGIANHESRSHLTQDLMRYMFSSMFASLNKRFPRLHEFDSHDDQLMPDHKSAKSGKFADRFRVQLAHEPATTVTSHISKDGHYFIHYDPEQCRSLTVREAARIQTFPDNYLFCGSRTSQYHQVGNAVPPYLAWKISKIVFDIFKQMK